MSDDSIIQKVQSFSLSGGSRRSPGPEPGPEEADTPPPLANGNSDPRQPSSRYLSRWTNNPIYKRVPRFVLGGISDQENLQKHEKIIKAWDMTDCWKYRSQSKLPNGVRVSFFDLDGERHEPTEGDAAPQPMDLLVVWPHRYAKRLRQSSGPDLLFIGYLAHWEKDCIPVLIRRATPGQRVQKDIMPFIPSQEKAAAIVSRIYSSRTSLTKESGVRPPRMGSPA